MKTIHERSTVPGAAHINCVKYRNLKNIHHFHSDYELIYVHCGEALVAIDENIFNLHEGQGAFICSNDIHCITTESDTVLTVAKITRQFYEKHFATRAPAQPIISDASGMGRVLEEVHRELASHAPHCALMADCAIIQFLISLLRSDATVERSAVASGQSSSHVLYLEICRKIAAEYKTVTFSDVCRHMHFSEPYFSKVFHNIFGITFTQYLNTIKIAAAIEKIKEGKMSVTEIALSCGFNTIRNFNRVFKKLTGHSPKELPSDYVFLYSLQGEYGLDPTLNCTVILED